MDTSDSIKMQDFCEAKKQYQIKLSQDTKNKLGKNICNYYEEELVSLKYGVLTTNKKQIKV